MRITGLLFIGLLVSLSQGCGGSTAPPARDSAATPDLLPAVDNQPPRSGTRLKVVAFVPVDPAAGAGIQPLAPDPRQTGLFFDTKLGVRCDFVQIPDGTYVCFPFDIASAAIMYSDPACGEAEAFERAGDKILDL